MKVNLSLKRLIRISVIACIYVVICLVTTQLSFGPIQVRLSESLTMLSVFTPEAIVGVTIGCFLSNMLASAPIDIVIGTAATLVSAVLTFHLRKIRLKKLALIPSIPPVVINAVVIGVELTLLYYPKSIRVSVVWMNILTVGLGQIISCSVVGVLLVFLIEKNPYFTKLLTE